MLRANVCANVNFHNNERGAQKKKTGVAWRREMRRADGNAAPLAPCVPLRPRKEKPLAGWLVGGRSGGSKTQQPAAIAIQFNPNAGRWRLGCPDLCLLLSSSSSRVRARDTIKNAAASAGVVDGGGRGVRRRRAAAQVLSAGTVPAGRLGVQTRPVPRGLDAVVVRRRRQRRHHEPVARGRRDDARLASRLYRRLAARPPAVQPGQPHVRAAAPRRPVVAADDPRTERAALPARRLLRRPPLGARLQRAVRRRRPQVLRTRGCLLARAGKN